MSLSAAFHRPLRCTVAGLWLVGIGLAGFTAPRAWHRTGARSALPFLAVAVLGALLTRGVLRADRRALQISSVLLGAQVAGVIGAAWQLIDGVSGPKARELRRLGFDPTLGVALNLAYSMVATGAFAWIVLRAKRDPPAS